MEIGGERGPGDKPKCPLKLGHGNCLKNRKVSGKIGLRQRGMKQVRGSQSRTAGHPGGGGDPALPSSSK